MPFVYPADFWLQRANEATLLAKRMSGIEARAAMVRTAWNYELMFLRAAEHEAKRLFEKTRESLRLIPDNTRLAASAELFNAKANLLAAREALRVHAKTR